MEYTAFGGTMTNSFSLKTPLSLAPSIPFHLATCRNICQSRNIVSNRNMYAVCALHTFVVKVRSFRKTDDKLYERESEDRAKLAKK
jgi:hypothetical protein